MKIRKIKRSLFIQVWMVYWDGVRMHHGASQYRRWNQ